jgi:hypothetical protein
VPVPRGGARSPAGNLGSAARLTYCTPIPMADPAPPSQSERLRKLPWGWVGAVLIFLVVAVVVRRSRGGRAGGRAGGPGQAAPASAGHAVLTPGERALFAPLAEGAALGPATVTSFTALPPGTLSVDVRFGTTPQTFRIARTTSTTRAMHLRATGPYTVYLVGPGAGTARPVIEQAWRALEAVLGRHTDLPVPPALLPCCPFNGSVP